MLTFTPRSVTNPDRPTTITVVAWHSPKTQLREQPLGLNMQLGIPIDPEIETVIDRVLDWQGFHWHGQNVSCSRVACRYVFAAFPEILADVRQAIESVSKVGVL